MCFITFVLQWVTNEPFGASGSPPFSVFNIVFTLVSRQIEYDDDDDIHTIPGYQLLYIIGVNGLRIVLSVT